MPSNYETFFNGQKFAVVGNSDKMNFPVLTYRGLKNLSKTVFPVDVKANEIDGDRGEKYHNHGKYICKRKTIFSDF